MDLHGIGVERLAESSVDGVVPFGPRPQVVVEELTAVAPATFGLVQCRLGIAEGLFGPPDRGAEGDAARDGQSVERTGSFDRDAGLAELFGEFHGSGHTEDVGTNDGELVAADAGEDVVATEDRLEPPGHGTQCVVTGREPPGVVVGLEAVDVDRAHGDAVLVVGRVLQCLIETGEKVVPAREAGQWVEPEIVGIVADEHTRAVLGADDGDADRLVGAVIGVTSGQDRGAEAGPVPSGEIQQGGQCGVVVGVQIGGKTRSLRHRRRRSRRGYLARAGGGGQSPVPGVHRSPSGASGRSDDD